jgi:hypothetical protein
MGADIRYEINGRMHFLILIFSQIPLSSSVNLCSATLLATHIFELITFESASYEFVVQKYFVRVI